MDPSTGRWHLISVWNLTNLNLQEASKVEYIEICKNDYTIFHELSNAYYREGEDENTPQDKIDAFIRFMFDKVVNNEVNGFFAKDECGYIGFALWAIDTEDFAFREIPGSGTIL